MDLQFRDPLREKADRPAARTTRRIRCEGWWKSVERIQRPIGTELQRGVNTSSGGAAEAHRQHVGTHYRQRQRPVQQVSGREPPRLTRLHRAQQKNVTELHQPRVVWMPSAFASENIVERLGEGKDTWQGRSRKCRAMKERLRPDSGSWLSELPLSQFPSTVTSRPPDDYAADHREVRVDVTEPPRALSAVAFRHTAAQKRHV